MFGKMKILNEKIKEFGRDDWRDSYFFNFSKINPHIFNQNFRALVYAPWCLSYNNSETKESNESSKARSYDQ